MTQLEAIQRICLKWRRDAEPREAEACEWIDAFYRGHRCALESLICAVEAVRTFIPDDDGKARP